MIADNELSNRLNAVKAGDEPPVVEQTDKLIEKLLNDNQIESLLNQKQFFEYKSPSAIKIFMTLLSMLDVLMASALYGYATKVILTTTTDWMWLETIGIGFIINSVLSSSTKIIKSLIKKFSK